MVRQKLQKNDMLYMDKKKQKKQAKILIAF